MDEIEVLTQHRPVPPPMTAAERAIAKEHLMTHIDTATRPSGAAPAPAEVDLTAPPRRNRRALRRVGLVAAAAAVAVVALAVGTGGSGPAPLRVEPTAAEELVALAAVVEATSVYPEGRYSVVSHQVMESQGGGIEDMSSSFDATLYRIDDNDTIARCDGGMACFARIGSSATNDRIPHDGTPAEVRAGLEAQIDAYAGPTPTGSELTWVRLVLISEELGNPALTAGVRAELLRIVAESADLSIEEDVASAVGLTGTRFVASTPSGELTLIIDPADGYLLEVGEEGTTRVMAAEVDGEGQPVLTETGYAATRTVLSYARPVAADPLPADVQALADDIAAVTPQIEAAFPSGGCAGLTGGNPGGPSTNYGLDVPVGLSALHCWLP